MEITVKTSEYIREFDELCTEYGLSKDSEVEGWDYLALQVIWIEKKQGQFFTTEEIIADFSGMESAMMLLQFLETSSNTFEVIVGSVTKVFECPVFFSEIKQFLIDMLNKRVQKFESLKFRENGVEVVKPAMILSKGYGGGFTGRAFIIPYPEGVIPQKECWSIEELTTIIKYEIQKKNEWLQSQGRKKRNSSQRTKRKEMKALVEYLLNFMPLNMNVMSQYAFMSDFMQRAGFFDYQGVVWNSDYEYMNNKEKYDVIHKFMEA